MKKIVLTLTIITILLLNVTTITAGNVEASNYTEQTEVESEVYPHDEVVDVNITITDENYQTLLNNAEDEEYYNCDITYNGVTLSNVAIRAKGNSSLRDVAQEGGDRFSFNIDLNYYQDQDLYGIDKLILNNLFEDPSMMAEYISYEALESLDATSSRTTYVALSINSEYYGLYLSVEHVSNEFLESNFGNSSNELYKPEMDTGANLEYTSSDRSVYTGLIDENEDKNESDTILDLLEAIDTKENIDSILDVDSFLKYLAVSTYVVHLDSYQGSMFHNYYLYNDDGTYEWIAWDLNMTFNGFHGAKISDSDAVEFLIDEPVIGDLTNYPLVEAILSNEDYLAQYHAYLQELLDNYFNVTNFTSRVTEIYNMIDSYVETDENSFYSYTQFEDAVYGTSTSQYSLITFVTERTSNVQEQLDGTIPSTNNGEGNDGNIMSGGMMGPGGGFPGGNFNPDGNFVPDGNFDPNLAPPTDPINQELIDDTDSNQEPVDDTSTNETQVWVYSLVASAGLLLGGAVVFIGKKFI